MKAPNILLIGPRAAGKSKASRHIHRPLDMPVLSTDVLASYEEAGASINDIVSHNGWPYFRDLEYDILGKVQKLQGAIIDCGGGMVIDLDASGKEKFSERKARLIRKDSLVIYLTADPEWLWQKVASDPERPQWDSERDAKLEFWDMMKRRSPWYQKLADIKFDTTGKRGKQIGAALLPLIVAKGFSIKRETRLTKKSFPKA